MHAALRMRDKRPLEMDPHRPRLTRGTATLDRPSQRLK